LCCIFDGEENISFLEMGNFAFALVGDIYPSVKNLIFGNAGKIGFLHKLLSCVFKLVVGTVYYRKTKEYLTSVYCQ
jgi:hypothetical protein